MTGEPTSTGRTGRRSWVDHLVMALATGFGVGASRLAPGTVGSLWGPPLVWGMQELGLADWTWGATAAAIALLGIPICSRAARILHQKDPGCVVYDEIAAFPIVFALTEVTWLSAGLGFAAFRLFDIWKPWPIRRFERLPGGWGIMADDLVAAAYAALAVRLLSDWLM